MFYYSHIYFGIFLNTYSNIFRYIMFYIKLNWLIINCVGKKYEKEWSGGRSTAVNIYKKETF